MGGGLKKKVFFLALPASVWSKNKRGGGGPLDLSLLFTYNSVLDL